MHPYPSASSSSSSPSSSHRHQAIFDEFESYPFSDDPDFTAGLPTVISAIRGTKRSAAQIDEMIGRAQWFYFTRLRGLQIPWEVYAQHTLRAPLPPSPAGGSTPLQPVPTNPLAAINQISESRRMMMSDDSQGEAAEGSGSGGMSFAMLSRLISEGRAGEVPVQYIPEGINEAQPSQSSLQARAKPWETSEPYLSHPSSPFINPYNQQQQQQQQSYQGYQPSEYLYTDPTSYGQAETHQQQQQHSTLQTPAAHSDPDPTTSPAFDFPSPDYGYGGAGSSHSN